MKKENLKLPKLTSAQKETLEYMKKMGSKWVGDGRNKRVYDKLRQLGYLTCSASFHDTGTWYYIKNI